MKKLLALILAMALVFSLMPNLFASAAEEETAVAETISYKISSNSISSALYEGTHFLPTETDVLSENYGKLKFTPTAGIQYADATVANIISNSSSTNTSAKNTSFANSELSLVSYRPITFYKMISSSGNAWDPNREYIYDSTGNKGIFFGSSWGIEHVSKVPVAYSTNGPTIDLTKTAPFELYGKSNGANHAWLEATGYYGTFSIGTSSNPDSFMTNVGTSLEPSFTIRIKIPEDAVAGKYTLKLGNNWTNAQKPEGIYGNANASKTSVYMTKIDPEIGFEGKFHNRYCTICYFTDAKGTDYLGSEAYERSAYAAEENLLGSYISTNSGFATFEKELTLMPGEEYVLYFAIDASVIDIDELNKGGEKGTFIAGGNIYNYNGAFYQNFKLSYIDLVPVDADYDASFDATIEENYTTGGTATVNAYTYTDKENSYSLNNAVALGGTYSAAAPEIEGYHFLYWAKGASSKKQIVSYEESFSFKPHEGANYLVAVFEKDGEETAKAEFYNANGDLIDTLTADGKAPELPTLAGYGNASGWVLYGDSTKTEYAENSDITVSGTMIFVANYANLPTTVTVNEEEYAYGDLVTLTADEVSGKVFKGWKKNGEIVSVSKTYTFYAYKTCTVEPIYADEEPNFSGKFIKIFIDTFSAGDETAIMAEFIGLGNAVEKGIIVNGTHKLAMKSDASQFTVTADVDGTYEGYAIIKDGTSYTQVTDGSAEVK